MSTQKPFKILFLCTGNSARSILAEYFIKRIAPDRFKAYSAGSNPTGKVNPFAVEILKEYRIDASDARSQNMSEFMDKGVQFDFVITVCDSAREACPIWPGQPIVAHWGSEDPAAVQGTNEEKCEAFRKVALQINRRLELFCSLPLEKMDRLRLEETTKGIGMSEMPATV